MILCVLACIVPAQAATPYMPHCSFLMKSATSAHEVANTIRTNRVVAQRFANHYGINNDAIADYIDRNGKVVTVTQPTVFTEYYVDSMGHTHKHQKRVQAGTKILVVQGKPIMDLRCGNPLTKALPYVAPPRPIAKVPPAKPLAPPPPPEVAVVPPTPPPPPPAAPPPPVVVTPPPPAAVAPVQQVSRRTTPFPWWIVLGGAAFIHTGEEKTPIPPPPPPKIPEASTLALGIGGMGVVFAAFRRHRGR